MIDWFRIDKPLGELIRNFTAADVSAYRFNQKYIFDGNGKKYALAIAIINIDGTYALVDPQNIIELSLTNEINNLCPIGTLTVVDPIGRIGELHSKFFTHIQVCFKTYSVNNSDDIETIDEPDSTFIHTYIVENCELVRLDTAVGYRFKLRSILWYKLSGNVIYSTFGKSESNILTSLKECLNIAFYDSENFISLLISEKNKKNNSKTLIDGDSFNSRDTENLNYSFITPANSTVFDIFTDLTSRLYYNITPPADRTSNIPKNIVIPTALVYFVFDIMNAKYKMIVHGNESTYIQGSKDPFTWITLRQKTFSEDLANQKQPEFGSMIGENATTIYQTLLTDKVYYKYSPTLNRHQRIDLKAETILESLNNGFPRDGEKLKLQPYETIIKNNTSSATTGQIAKFNSLIATMLLPSLDQLSYTREYSFSDSTTNNPEVYREMINLLLYRDAVVMTAAGEITHQPGMYFMVNLDNATPVGPNTPVNSAEDYKTANLQFQGIFNIVRVTHIIRPAAKDPGERFRESVVLNKLTYPVKEPFA